MQINGFIQYLIDKNYLTNSIIETAAVHAKQPPMTLLHALAHYQLVNQKILAEQTAHYFKLPQIDLNNSEIPIKPTDVLPEVLIKKYNVLPLFYQNEKWHIGIIDPSQSLEEIKFHISTPIQWMIAEYNSLTYTINSFLSQKQYTYIQDYSRMITAKDDETIINFVQQLLTDAIYQNASDIHFEPYEKFYRVRLRVDGILHETTHLPIALSPRIAARLKVLAKLDIAEKRLPQDGRFTVTLDKFARECRISTCPTLFGEKIVVRILDSNKINLHIDELGLELSQKQYILSAIQKPQGMLLVTGPTGSGKTITLYTALNLLNTCERNISTVEDPIEIQLPGINQVQVNHKTGLDFTLALRTFLRQDPDVIMVGEIRDMETAEIAIKSAQTGHLVLSTVHTNSAAETLTRLMNMGIVPFNIASSITLIIAQRLARKLCIHCKQLKSFSQKELLSLGFSENMSSFEIYIAKGCEHCLKGYKGRVGIFEMIPMTENIEHIILNHGNSMDIEKHMQENNLINLKQAALNKVKQGITTLEEINRVINL